MSPTPTTPTELISVAELLPAFEFEGLIAHGDSGSVFKARQRSLDRDVAIKFIPLESSADRSCAAGAKAMASLAHPNLIRVYDSGEAGGFFYIVMEYIPGKSLGHSARGKAIEPRQASQIVIAACEGLAHAHASGVIHGSIKPSDILLTAKCEPKIGNFGAQLQIAGDVCPRSDVFSLGLILRELLTGVAMDAEASARAVFPDLRLAAICRKATHPDPAQRYEDTTSLGDALTRAIAPVETAPSAQKRQASPLLRPKPALVVKGGYAGHALVRNCAVIACLLFSIYGLWGYHEAQQERLTRLQLEENAKPKVIFAMPASDVAEGMALVSWDR